MRTWLVATALVLTACGGDGSGGGSAGAGDTASTTATGGGGSGGGGGGGTGGGGGGTGDGNVSDVQDFLYEFNRAICDQYFACLSSSSLPWATVEECYALVTGTNPTTTDTSDCPDFSVVAGQVCVDVVDAWTCDEFRNMLSSGNEPPECSEEALCGT